MSLYIQVPIQQIADGLTAIGWSSAGGGGDATLSYSATEPETPVNGTLWYDTTATLLKLYTGGTWTTINVSAETIATISGYVTLAQSAANDAEQKLTEFKAIQVTATTLSVGASATASYDSGTGVITLGIPTGATGIKGVDGEVSTAQLNTAISGITKISLGLSNVDNTTDANKPVSIATQTALNLKADATALTTKQDALVSGTNIKTINGTSVLGSGDIVISSSKNYEFIGKVVASGATNVIFSSIPTTYVGLKLFTPSFNISDNGSIYFSISTNNGSTLINCEYQQSNLTTSSSLIYQSSQNSVHIGMSYSVSTMSSLDMNIFTAPSIKASFNTKSFYKDTASTGGVHMTSGVALTTGAINYIKLIAQGAQSRNFTGTFYLYGIKE